MTPAARQAPAAILFLVASAAIAGAGRPPLTTVSEDSGFTKTGRYDEVVRLCGAFPKAYRGRVKRLQRCRLHWSIPFTRKPRF